MAVDRLQRRRAAILAAEVASYSRLIGKDEERTLATLALYDSFIDGLIAQYNIPSWKCQRQCDASNNQSSWGIQVTMHQTKFTTAWTALLFVLGVSHSSAFDPQAVERLKSKPVCPDCDLSRVSLREAYLPGAILTNANLAEADLAGSNLNGADLSRSNLTGADLSGASLKYVVLTGADLRGAVLAKTELPGANLNGADLSGALFEGANLRGARFAEAVLSGANFESANLQYAENINPSLLADVKLCNTRMPDGVVNNTGC